MVVDFHQSAESGYSDSISRGTVINSSEARQANDLAIPTIAVGLDQKMCYIPRPRFFQRANVGPEHAISQAVI
ncbi:hypothetical protein ABNM12_17980 [Pseudomonas syringae]|uniref:hypothetical protein n=1 Tax=Pseudomonas TaxID=286 RepID=UPI001011C2DA|nr:MULTISPECIES: hypothetical protein [Pseudomonas]MCH5489288.1 hypothetical protein [Pseudomonas syringae pv. syringae]MCH5509648.1 hypothetical protein [Pseudomonas syringae pv. syringae]MCH5513497.1 hypothetical protein [Pseudomonas syringae pv. syringae]MCH5549344.1 hypothetical protein [Pseudomonas syringae pv. syringae]MCH5555605.1 hypothetical protein [Pseudomonas syringae pv. syringae]